MLPLFALAMATVGVGIGRILRRPRKLVLISLVLAVLSGVGAFYPDAPPFNRLVRALGVYYVVLIFEVFFTASGVLVGILSRRIRIPRGAL